MKITLTDLGTSYTHIYIYRNCSDFVSYLLYVMEGIDQERHSEGD